MKYRPLGTTGLFVSELCLGTMTFGGKDYWAVVGTQGQGEADELVGTALDATISPKEPPSGGASRSVSVGQQFGEGRGR